MRVAATQEVGVVLEVVVPAGEKHGSLSRHPGRAQLHRDRVVVDIDVARPVGRPTSPSCMCDRDSISVAGHDIPVDLNVLRARNQDPGPAEPGFPLESVAAHSVVSDHGIGRGFVKDPGARVVFDTVAFVSDVDVVRVRPQPGALVVVDVVPAHDESTLLEPLGATGLPAVLEVRVVVESDLVVLVEKIDPVSGVADHSDLAIVVDEISPHDLPAVNTDAVVETNLVPIDHPRFRSVDAGGGELFDNQSADYDVLCRRELPLERHRANCRFDFVPMGIVGDVDLVRRVIEIEAAWLQR